MSLPVDSCCDSPAARRDVAGLRLTSSHQKITEALQVPCSNAFSYEPVYANFDCVEVLWSHRPKIHVVLGWNSHLLMEYRRDHLFQSSHMFASWESLYCRCNLAVSQENHRPSPKVMKTIWELGRVGLSRYLPSDSTSLQLKT